MRIDIPMIRRIIGYDLGLLAILAGPVGVGLLFSSGADRPNLVGTCMVAIALVALVRNLRFAISTTESHIEVRRITTKRIPWSAVESIEVVSTAEGRNVCQIELSDGSHYEPPVESWFEKAPERLAAELRARSPVAIPRR